MSDGEVEHPPAVGERTATVAAATTTTTVHVGLHGTAPIFDETQEEWAEYAERLESYFLANDVADPAKKRAILVNAVGPKTYRLIKTLCLPEKPHDHTLEEIVDRVKAHFHPKPSPLIRRFEFNGRNQKQGETIAEFTAAIRKIADDCAYGTVLNDMLRDRLVFGVADKRLQKRLLRESSKITYAQARDMALAAESANKDAKRIQAGHEDESASTPGDVAYVDRKPRTPRGPPNRVRQPDRTSPSSTCYRCGGKHDASKCRFKDYECRYCHKKGHLAKACHKKARDKPTESTHRVDASLSSRTFVW